MSNKFSCCFLFLLLLSFNAFSQQPIGVWHAYMPYNNAVSAATDGVTIYAGSDASFFTYNAAHDEIATYSKVNGMSDVGISYIGYDATTGFAIIAYRNGNIDLFKDETFYNIPDLKIKNISPKNINHIYAENGFAYLSTSFGIVVLNLAKKETKETYAFTSNSQSIEVKEFASAGTYFYAVTANGLYKANKNNPNLQAFASWQKIDNRNDLFTAAVYNNKVFVAKRDSVFAVQNDTLAFVYHSQNLIVRIDKNDKGLFVNQYIGTDAGKVVLFDVALAQATDSFNTPKAINTFMLSDGSTWCADIYEGLAKRDGGGVNFFNPDGPAAIGSFDILPYNGDVWIAHGGYDENWTYQGNRSGISHLEAGKWKQYSQKTTAFFRDNNLTDFIVLAKDPVTGDLYAGSYRAGLFILKADGTYQLEKYGSGYVEHNSIDTGSYRVAGLTFDQNNNLWINNAGAQHELAVKTAEGNTRKYSGPGTFFYSAYTLTDDYNMKWYILPSGGDGVVVYNDNYTPENPADDAAMKITTSRFSLNSYVNCIAHDKENAIWIGTNDGIGVINCSPDQVATGSCEIRKPIVQYDQFAGYLFQNEKVKTIAVDGANRKWIGTTNGVWLISPDGDKIIYRFTVDNSPLPSNTIQKIAVDPITGVVYVGTSEGLVSFRSTATEGGESNTNVLVFPNPVPSGYSGSIAIRGLVENADVRITDISGQLVYRTTALGGQAVWNGHDYTGRTPQSGVYLIFVTNKDGSQTHIGKMVFMQ